MRKLLTILSFLGLFTSIFAQIPNGFSYQAVVRNSEQMLLKNQEVTIKATILRNDEALFEQTQTATTNENGLLTIVIGNESFQDIDWLQGTLFIKTEIDPAGGNNFTIETQTQLLTVPYSMAAKVAEFAINAPQGEQGPPGEQGEQGEQGEPGPQGEPGVVLALEPLFLDEQTIGIDLTEYDNKIAALTEEVENLKSQLEELKVYIFGEEPDFWYEEYSLSETLCHWKNFQPTAYNGYEIIIINSNEHLEQYISCAGSNYPEMDFSKSSLLLVSGLSLQAVGNIVCENFLQLSANEYEMTIEIPLYKHYNSVGWERYLEERWYIAIISKKIDEGSNVTINITEVETSCKVENLNFWDDFLYVINSNEELEYFLDCTDNTGFLNIDFSKHTLLMANGSTLNVLKNINSWLTKLDENTYVFEIDIEITAFTASSRWIVKSLIKKIPPDAVVLLNVTGNGWN